MSRRCPVAGSRSQGSIRRWDQGPGRRVPGAEIPEDFNYDHQPGLKRDTIAHLATGAFLTEAPTSSCSAPAKPTSPLGWAYGLQLGHRVLFATAIDWFARLQATHQNGSLPQELFRLRRYVLIIVDEVGYISFAQDAANPFFQLVSSRDEHGLAETDLEPAVRRLG